jgi:hypothetical protein
MGLAVERDQPGRGRPKDRTLYTSLVHAGKSNLLVISVDPRRLNYPGSPVWQAEENVAPLIGLFAIAILLLFINALVGVAALVLCGPIFLLAIRPWIFLRVRQRAMDSAMLNMHNWEVLWRKGGLSLTSVVRRTRCQSPGGDWRTFVKDNVPIVEVEASVAHFGETAQSDMPAPTVMSENW